MKNHKIALLIGIILFFVPFFWLKPGEMNLGGDAGRLYFYDPYSFLKNYTLYNFIQSGIGVEAIGYVFFPYAFVLFLLKVIFQSSTILIAISNGIILSSAFLSVYFIVRELIEIREFSFKEKIINYSSILAGFFYIFSQELIYAGWEAPLITHNQLFLNPFIFLLLLRYLLTKNFLYIVSALLVSVIFTTNFAYVGAPTFFAFYPLAILFLFSYIKLIRKLPIPYKGLTFGIVLFLLIHAFHLLPELSAVFSFSSKISKTVFSTEGESSRGGLDYFIAIASSTKVSLIWMSAAQFQKDIFSSIFIVFPLTLIAGLFYNRGKTILLTAIFFLIAMFFTSANITDTGFFIYKQLFRIPGFSMFRNFHGQFAYIFIFFYALFFGQAVALISHRLSKNIAPFFIGIFVIFILIMGSPFLNGSIPIPRHTDTGLRFAIRMDPMYENVLNYFRTAQTDSKVLTLPLTGPGYQVLQGKDGGLYQGLPTIPYLTGRGDFSGFESFGPFRTLLLNAMKNKNYDLFNRILAIMNIHYIYYNSDPYIYSGVLKDYLYYYVSQFNPQTQSEYKSFIEKLPIVARTDFGDKYHVYTLDPAIYFPHIFTAKEREFTNNSDIFTLDLAFQRDLRDVVLPLSAVEGNKDEIFIYSLPKIYSTEIEDNSHFHKHFPFLRRKPSAISYPLTISREKLSLILVKSDPIQYLNISLLLLSKRKSEMVDFGKNMEILRKPWKEPQLWEVKKWRSYNSWDASISRYENDVDAITDWINKSAVSDEQKIVNKIKVSEQLYQHEIDLIRALRQLDRTNDEKKYLYSVINSMFKKLHHKVNIPIFDPSLYTYSLPAYTHQEGAYEVYLDKRNNSIQDLNRITISIGDKTIRPIVTSKDSNLLRFSDIAINSQKDLKVKLTLPADDLIKNKAWDNSGFSVEGGDEVISMVINNNIGEFTGGFTTIVQDWTVNSRYLISFDYDTNGKDFTFSFFDKRSIADQSEQASYRQLFEKKLNSNGFKTHQSVVFAERDTVGGILKIVPFFSEGLATIKLKNVVVRRVDYPQLIFKKIVPTDSQRRRPHIVFTKINPTKYLIDIKKATDPYTLIFLESLNDNWKLVDITSDSKTISATISRTFGKIGSFLTGIFIKNRGRADTISASYFSGEVKEGEHNNIFLEPNTFETWGKNFVAEERHFLANSYANAWYIKPADMNKKSEYTLVLELKSQQEFYPAFFVSITTLVLLIAYRIFKFLREWKK